MRNQNNSVDFSDVAMSQMTFIHSQYIQYLFSIVIEITFFQDCFVSLPQGCRSLGQKIDFLRVKIKSKMT